MVIKTFLAVAGVDELGIQSIDAATVTQQKQMNVAPSCQFVLKLHVAQPGGIPWRLATAARSTGSAEAKRRITSARKSGKSTTA